MRKGSPNWTRNEIRPEYDLKKLKGGVRGKYYERAKAGSNLVLVDSDLAKIFSDAASVNRALRALRDAAGATARQSKVRRRRVSRRKRTAA